MLGTIQNVYLLDTSSKDSSQNDMYMYYGQVSMCTI